MNLIDHYLKKNIKVIGLMKDELGGKIVTKFIRLRAKTYSYLMKIKNQKTKTFVPWKNCKFENYKNCLKIKLRIE